ncbi:IS630 family transposase, partial [Glycomyces sp. L485]|nr:IS630 family transposase [Glycomyces sp. L485]
PDELVWNTVKRGIGRTAIKDAGGLHRTALGALRRLQKLPETVRSFFGHPELAYIATAASK